MCMHETHLQGGGELLHSLPEHALQRVAGAHAHVRLPEGRQYLQGVSIALHGVLIAALLRQEYACATQRVRIDG